jgi:hypothetical protein
MSYNITNIFLDMDCNVEDEMQDNMSYASYNKITIVYTCKSCVYVMINSKEYCKLCCDKCTKNGNKNCVECIFYKDNDVFCKKSLCRHCI